MLFRQIEYFVAVANERHFARAAAACHVSQPALSAAIAKLEHEIGATLIYRDRAFQGLTPAGERLVVWAKRILAEHNAFLAEAHSLGDEMTGTLRLGAIPTASTTSALAITVFCARHPLVRVELSTGHTSAEIERLVAGFDVDAGITYAPTAPTSLQIIPLYREHYVLVAHEGLLPDGDAPVTWDDTAQLPLVLLSPQMHSREVVDGAFLSLGLRANPQVETDSIGALFALVRAGGFASVMPHSWVHAHGLDPNAGVRILPLAAPHAIADVVVVAPGDLPGSPIARAFAAAAQAARLDTLFAGIAPS